MTGEDIKKIRSKLGWPQWRLAEHLGIEQATVSRLESGEWEPSGPVRKLLEQLAQPASPEAAA